MARTLEEAEAEVTSLKDGIKTNKGQMNKLAFSGVAKAVGEREVEVIITSTKEDRDKDIVETTGIKLQNYNRNPVVLFQHNANRPVARTVRLDLMPNKMIALAKFPAAGRAKDSDEVYGLIQDEIINSASIGFIPKVYEPRNPEVPWGGQHFKEVDLLEWSFVTIPSNTDALIIGRSYDLAVGKFFSWAGDAGLCFGQMKMLTDAEAHLAVWEMKDGRFQENGEMQSIPAAEAATALAPFKGFEKAEDVPEDSGCANGGLPDTGKEARLRAIKALRLRTT